MSGLLKAGDHRAQSAVRPLGTGFEPQVETGALALPALRGAAPAELSQQDRQQNELEATIADLRQRLADAVNEADEREDAAFERGRREGEDLATGEADKRLELLSAGLEALLQAHADRLSEYELLALQLARAGLARIFGDETLHAGLVAEAVGHRLASVKHDLVLGVRVAQRDFRSEEELAALAARFAGIEIVQDDALEAGDCAIDLRLGAIDLGVPGQWRRLVAFFEHLAHEEPGR